MHKSLSVSLLYIVGEYSFTLPMFHCIYKPPSSLPLSCEHWRSCCILSKVKLIDKICLNGSLTFPLACWWFPGPPSVSIVHPASALQVLRYLWHTVCCALSLCLSGLFAFLYMYINTSGMLMTALKPYMEFLAYNILITVLLCCHLITIVVVSNL